MTTLQLVIDLPDGTTLDFVHRVVRELDNARYIMWGEGGTIDIDGVTVREKDEAEATP